MIKNFFITLVFSLFLISNSYSIESFYNDAKKLFDKKKYEDSKFLFQRDIVFNPKEAKSYLYLAKIYKIEENLKALAKASGFLRTKLAKRLDIRKVPKLRFFHDNSIRKGQQLSDLIDEALGVDSQRHRQGQPYHVRRRKKGHGFGEI